MTERQESRWYSTGNPVPESVVLQKGYCFNESMYDYIDKDDWKVYSPIMQRRNFGA